MGENFKFPCRGLYNLYVVQYVFWRGLIHCTACRLVTRINCTILSYFVGVINCTTCHFAGTVIIVQHDLLRVIPVLFSNHLEYQGFNSHELLTNKLRSVWEFTVTVYIWSVFLSTWYIRLVFLAAFLCTVPCQSFWPHKTTNMPFVCLLLSQRHVLCMK